MAGAAKANATAAASKRLMRSPPNFAAVILLFRVVDPRSLLGGGTTPVFAVHQT
jgi:hypothetical protein